MKNIVFGMILILTGCSKNMNPQNALNKETPKENIGVGEIVRSLEASVASVVSPSGNEVEGVVNVDFGTVLNTESKTLLARIRNNSTAGERIVSVTRVASPENYFIQSTNGCNNIGPKSQCDIRMTFNGKASPQNEGGPYSGQWVINFSDNTSKTVQMNIQVTLPVPSSPAEIEAQQAAQLANLSFDPVSMDFGEILETESKTLSVIIRNNNTVPVTFSTSVQQPFSLTAGCLNIAAKSSCTARVTLSGAGKSGSQGGSFYYGIVDNELARREVPLSGVVKTTAQVIAETPLIQNITSSVESIDFGTLNPDGISTKSITFRNNSNLPVTLPTVLSSTDYRIISDACNNKQVAINSTCSVRISLSGFGKPAGELAPATLSYGNKSIPLSGEIMSAAEVALIEQEQAALLSNIVLEYQGLQYSSADTLNLGSKSQGQIEQLQFVLRNTGSAPATISSVSFASNINIISSNCSTRLSPNSSCNIRATLNPQSQSPLNLSANLGFEVRQFPISFTLTGPNVACTPSNALNNGVTDMNGVLSVSGNLPNCVVASCNETSHTLLGLNQSRCGAISYQPVYSSYGTCSAPVCGGIASGSQARTYTCDRLVDGSNPNPVSESFCSSLVSDLSISCDSPAGTVENVITGGTQTLSCAAGSTVQTFQSVACASPNFEVQGQICASVSYQPVYSSYSTCSAQACDGPDSGTQTRTYTCNKLLDGSNPTPVDNANCSSLVSDLSISCDSPAGIIENVITGGTQTLSCSAGSTVQTFQSVSCPTAGYEANGQICSALSYQPIYSSTYLGCTAPNPCDGEGTETSSLQSCQKLLDGQPVSGGQLSDCSSFNPSISRDCFSPAGIKTILPFDGGTKTVTCSIGEIVAQGTVDIVCNQNFVEENGLCVPIASGWKQISAGTSHTCAVTTTGQAFCWGSALDGRLGNGGSVSSNIPVAVTANAGLTQSNVASISAGGSHTCAVTTTGQAFCWGNNSGGQLGNGSINNSNIPLAVSSNAGLTTSNVAKISSGNLFTCALTTTGQAFCWGSALDGRLGNGTLIGSNIPLSIAVRPGLTSTNVASISSGGSHTCVVTTSRQAFCWGLGTAGQLGNGSSLSESLPVSVSSSAGLTSTNVANISAGGSHTCAITTSGQAFCWGAGTIGQLGNGSLNNSNIPVSVSSSAGLTSTNVANISAGGSHACAITTSGQAFCWGRNTNGQIGDGTSGTATSKSTPAPITANAGLTQSNVFSISSGGAHTCSITLTNQAFCWGSAVDGRLGNGSATGIFSLPVEVSPF